MEVGETWGKCRGNIGKTQQISMFQKLLLAPPFFLRKTHVCCAPFVLKCGKITYATFCVYHVFYNDFSGAFELEETHLPHLSFGRISTLSPSFFLLSDGATAFRFSFDDHFS